MPSASEAIQAELRRLGAQVGASSPPASSDIDLLFDASSSPDSSTAELAGAVLARAFALRGSFAAALHARLMSDLKDAAGKEQELEAALNVARVGCAADMEGFTELLQGGGVLRKLAEKFLPVSSAGEGQGATIVELDGSEEGNGPSTATALLRLLAELAGLPPLRPIAQETVAPSSLAAILQTSARSTEGSAAAITDEAKAVALLLLIKLSVASSSSSAATPAPAGWSKPPLTPLQLLSLSLELLAPLLRSASPDKMVALVPALEGLAVLSLSRASGMRDQLAASKVLGPLLELLPTRAQQLGKEKAVGDGPTRMAGMNVAELLGNLLAYSSHTTEDDEEDAAIHRLRELALSPSTPAPEDRATTLARNSKLYNTHKNALEKKINVLLRVLPLKSWTVRNGARIYLALVEDQKLRGSLLAAGAAGNLLGLLAFQAHARQQEETAKSGMSREEKQATQALAKLLITSNPLLSLGPSPSSPGILAATAFLLLPLLSGSSNQLEKFESLMALTNLASLGPEVASRILAKKGVREALDDLLLSGGMLARAAAELVCNLLQAGLGGEGWFHGAGSGSGSEGMGKKRVRIILALCEVEDLPTRLAASAGLAGIADEPEVAGVLASAEGKGWRIMKSLVEGNDDERARAAAVLAGVGVGLSEGNLGKERQDWSEKVAGLLRDSMQLDAEQKAELKGAWGL